ncbi:hypothetical protein SDC9_89619 [bioreactor metagenome]|uniref:Uncharacterized protein n=1 Tax=bioreactor metagenome TaxID=1076179 RepID=A0A644ZQB1_9ZZZZ
MLTCCPSLLTEARKSLVTTLCKGTRANALHGHQGRIDLIKKATGMLEACLAPDSACSCAQKVEVAAGSGDCHVEDPALLLHIIITFAAATGKKLFLKTSYKDPIELQPLGVVHRDQGDPFLITGILASQCGWVQGELLQELKQALK